MDARDIGDLYDVVLDANGNIIGVVQTPVIEMQESNQGVWQVKK